MATSRTVAERFWEKVDKSGPVPEHDPKLGRCWVWLAGKLRDGYGKFDHERVHRLSLEWASGEKHGGRHCLHRCDNRACVNPDHLYWGTPAQNALDRKERGRTYRCIGESNPRAKLTAQQVIEMRAAAAAGASSRTLAKRYGLNHSSVLNAVNGITWKNLLSTGCQDTTNETEAP